MTTTRWRSARVLADAGAELTLAYVRHTTNRERSREELEEHEAEALLERGARWLGDPDVPRRVLVSASTGEGLKWLAEQEERRLDRVRVGLPHRRPATFAPALGPAAARRRPGRASRSPLPTTALTGSEIRTDRRARRSRRRRRDRDRAWARRAARRDRHPRRAPGRPAGRRLASRGARGPRADHRQAPARDRERHRARCSSSPAASRSASPGSRSTRASPRAHGGARAIVRACRAYARRLRSPPRRPSPARRPATRSRSAAARRARRT